MNWVLKKIGAPLLRCNTYLMKYNPYVKLIVSLYPGIAAIWIAFNKDSIIDHTKVFFKYDFQKLEEICSIHFPTLIYWTLLLIWIVLYFTFVTNESEVNKRNTKALESAIFRSPNPNIFSLYYFYYQGIMEQIAEIKADNPLGSNANFDNILKIISQLTRDYINGKESDNSSTADYSASIMMYIPKTGNENLLKKMKQKDEEWIHFKSIDLATITGALHLVKEFDSKNDAIAITLPVIWSEKRSDMENKNLPGAPAVAALESQGDIKYVMSDVNNSASYSYLGQVEVENAAHYWRKMKPKVKSFVSFPISYHCPENAKDEIKIVGVLNINSAKGDVLGDEKFQTTFTALIYPFLCQIAPHLANYRKKYVDKLVDIY